MAIAAAQLAASSATAKFATSPSVALSYTAPSGLSFAPLSARRSPLGGSSRISVRKAHGNGKVFLTFFFPSDFLNEPSADRGVFWFILLKWSGGLNHLLEL